MVGLMETLELLLHFFAFPALVVVFGILTYRGEPTRYKIVRETNSLGEERFELWYKYSSLLKSYPWCLEGTFTTEAEAHDFMAREKINRIIVSEGVLSESKN
jgi:hypothetical protein